MDTQEPSLLLLSPQIMKSPLPSFLNTIAAVAFACAVSANAQNIVQDPGFELSPGSPSTGGFSAVWTLNPPAGTGPGQQLSNVGTNPAFAHSGNNHANLEFSQGASTAMASLSQTLTTVAGQTYNLSFWLANYVALPTNLFQVYINGVLLATNPSALMSPPFPADGVYRQVTGSFAATGTSTLLEFRYHHDQDFWYLDDVSVARAAATVPEGGASLWIAAPLLAGLCLIHLRGRRAAAKA